MKIEKRIRAITRNKHVANLIGWTDHSEKCSKTRRTEIVVV